MSKYGSRVKQFGRNARGATALEYAAAGAFIATAALGLAGAIGTTIRAESYATLLNGKVLVASSKKDLVRISARSSSDPIQTGSTSAASEPRKRKARARRLARAKRKSLPVCTSADVGRSCRLDISHASFKGWRGTDAVWLPDH